MNRYKKVNGGQFPSHSSPWSSSHLLPPFQVITVFSLLGILPELLEVNTSLFFFFFAHMNGSIIMCLLQLLFFFTDYVLRDPSISVGKRAS